MSVGATEPTTKYGMFGGYNSTPQSGPVQTTNSDGTPISSMYTSVAGDRTTKATEDKDTFLKLLVAQMKYQDPTNPADSSQFMAQTAQFTALEKMQAVADKTDQLLQTQMAFGANSMVGRQITWLDDAGAEQSGLVNGVKFDKMGPLLQVGERLVPLNIVSSSSTPAAAATPAPPPAPSAPPTPPTTP